ncbi:MAG TPA: adenylate/guanylate cyclase domain-containing protein [Xanthobacteraceae bacterium]|jgi:class 3 adenylate cyclase
MERVRTRDVIAAFAIALLAGVLAVLPPFDLLQGWSVDALTALRWRVYGNRYEPASSPAVVIGIDAQTYNTAPFKDSATFLWTPEIARVLNAVIEGGARVIGTDVVFERSIELSTIPFEGEPLGGRLHGFDREFLRTLNTGGRAGKLVLGGIELREESILPTRAQRFAVGFNNIRALNVYGDPDDVVRRVPLTFEVGGKSITAFAAELAARSLGTQPQIVPGPSLSLAGYRIPAGVSNTLTLNFEGGSQDIPTYSLADLLACAEQGDQEFFRRNFNGKAVILGSVEEAEDRKFTSKRFATAPERPATERCVLPPPATAAFTARSIPGPYIHATAVNNIIRRNALVETGSIQSGAIATTFAAIPAVAALMLPPAGALLSFLALGTIWSLAAVAAFEHAIVLPLLESLFAGLEALFVTIGFRLWVTDKDRRFLRQSFALYLAPTVVEKMMRSSRLPSLGGETRTVTMFFSDVEGFSTFGEKMSPSDLVALTNAYLAAMTDIIEEHGGFVDKYIGDAIVGVFGAPVADEDHAAQAVQAALACCRRLAELNTTAAAFKGQALHHRIGLNSGEALVGNIGSGRRFNYTVIGDVVNLASRLEGANKYFGTSILASETTMTLTGAKFFWREIDMIRVIGREQPLRVYEPVAEAGKQTPAQSLDARIYGKALAFWRGRDFGEAAEALASIADHDPPATLFMHRAKQMALSPPDRDWEPINALEGK